MGSRPAVSWQASLFEEEQAGAPRLSFEGLRHEPLDERSWVDLVPHWVPDHGALFDRLIDQAPWVQGTRKMWDDVVTVPRLTANVPFARLPELEEMRALLSERYGVELDSCFVNLYRDGDDAVAWHGDTVRKKLTDPLVVTVSLGARRRFLLKRREGGPVVREYAPGEGDLMVMGGACQHEWLHAVPRDKRASGARMSVTMRHSAQRLSPT